MVNEQKGRVNDALTSLVKLYFPKDRDENEEIANNRREDVHARLKRIIEGNVFRLGTLSKSTLMDSAGTIKGQFHKISITRQTELEKLVREQSSALRCQALTTTHSSSNEPANRESCTTLQLDS